MPKKALKPCKHPGCPKLTEGAYCDEHKPLHPDRPSAAKRGYGSRWQRHRDGSQQQLWSTISFRIVVIRI